MSTGLRTLIPNRQETQIYADRCRTCAYGAATFARMVAAAGSGSESCRFDVEFVSDLAVLGGLVLAKGHLIGIFMSVEPEAVRVFEERVGPGNGCDHGAAIVFCRSHLSRAPSINC
jgi:hypothetical protein